MIIKMARNENFADITEIMRQRGERIPKGGRLIVATGGNYSDTRRFRGYPAGGSSLKLYPADAYTYSVTPRPFTVPWDLIEVRHAVVTVPDPATEARKKAAGAAAERRELRRRAKAEERASQCNMFGGDFIEDLQDLQRK